jgi:hypothetical protein
MVAQWAKASIYVLGEKTVKLSSVGEEKNQACFKEIFFFKFYFKQTFLNVQIPKWRNYTLLISEEPCQIPPFMPREKLFFF